MRSEQTLALEFASAHPIEAADVLSQLPPEDRLRFISENSPDIVASLFRLMDPTTVSDDLANAENPNACEIVARLPMEIAAVLLRRLKEEKRAMILTGLPEAFQERLKFLLHYRENSVGASMDTQVLTFFDDLDIKNAVELISTQPKYVLFYIPVIDRQHRFIGVVGIRELMLAPPTAPLESIMEPGIATLSPESDLETIASHQGWMIFHELPVVDRNGVFLGVLSHRVLRRLQIEAEESDSSDHLVDTGRALGELYWLGISALAKGASSIVSSVKDKKGH